MTDEHIQEPAEVYGEMSAFKGNVLHRTKDCNTYCEPGGIIHAEIVYEYTIGQGRLEEFSQAMHKDAWEHGVILERCREIEEYVVPERCVDPDIGTWKVNGRVPRSAYLCYFREQQ